MPCFVPRASRSSARRAIRPGSAGDRSRSPSAPSRARSFRSIRRAARSRGFPPIASIAAAPGPIDQAIIAVPAKAALAAADECIAKGVKAAVMFSSGFAETGAEGRALQVELTRRCRAGGMKLLGPNSLGMFNVHAGLYCDLLVLFRSALAAHRAGQHREPERRVRHLFPRDRGRARARLQPFRRDRERGRCRRRGLRRMARRRSGDRRDHDLSRGLQ